MTSNSSSTIIDPYQVLGISHNATENEIKRAYKRAALDHHPDRIKNADKLAEKRGEEKMALINEAYGILRDPDHKRRFDHFYKHGAFGNGTTRSSRASEPGPAPFSVPQQNQGEVNFQVPYGVDPFIYISKPKHSSASDGDAASNGLSFTFSSITTRSVDSKGTLTFHRKVVNCKNGWKETITESVTVENSGEAVYKNQVEREDMGHPLQYFKNAFLGGFSRLADACGSLEHQVSSVHPVQSRTKK
jgi:curved DNA-binding protein CbpA